MVYLRPQQMLGMLSALPYEALLVSTQNYAMFQHARPGLVEITPLAFCIMAIVSCITHGEYPRDSTSFAFRSILHRIFTIRQ